MPRHYLHFFIFLCVAGYLIAGNPDATFQSSDANWADSEVQFKGRNFKRITYFFEKYQKNCNAPEATLIRTSPRNWFNIFAWPRYIFDKKWKVPYAEGKPEIGIYYPPVSMEHCYNTN